jgi:hypothetical protein
MSSCWHHKGGDYGVYGGAPCYLTVLSTKRADDLKSATTAQMGDLRLFLEQ